MSDAVPLTPEQLRRDGYNSGYSHAKRDFRRIVLIDLGLTPEQLPWPLRHWGDFHGHQHDRVTPSTLSPPPRSP
jgi:hypothetical protein